MSAALTTAVAALAGVVVGGVLERSGQRKLWLRQRRVEAYAAFSSVVSQMVMLYLRQRNRPAEPEDFVNERAALLQQAHDVHGRLNLIATPKVNRTSKVLLGTLLEDFDADPSRPLPSMFDAQNEAFINACQDDLVSSRWWKPWALHRVTQDRAL